MQYFALLVGWFIQFDTFYFVGGVFLVFIVLTFSSFSLYNFVGVNFYILI